MYMGEKERWKTLACAAGVATPSAEQEWIALVLSRCEKKERRFTWERRFQSLNMKGNVMLEFLLSLAALLFVAIAEAVLDENQ